MDVLQPVVNMSPAELQAHAQLLEVGRRRAEAASAMLVREVDAGRVFKVDGHRNAGAWGRGTNNWSGAESTLMVQLGRAFGWLPKFAEKSLAGAVGVAQMHTVARLAANPRVREFLAEADELFVSAACDLPFDDFVVVLRHWEELADADGARQRHDRAVRDRRAGVRFVGERAVLEAQGPSFDGVLFDEVLQHFVQIEWQTEWDLLAGVHGDAMCAALMERTHSQRTFDALQRIFAAAANLDGESGEGVAVTVDIVIDQVTFEHELEAMLGGTPHPVPPSHAPDRRCEDAQGRVVDPRAVVAAALTGQVRRLVLGADGVPVDMGRRQRLFRGTLREAVLLAARRCPYPGCPIPASRCEADHLHPAASGGPTSARNGGPGCGHHNRHKNNGTRTFRDAKGRWRTFRPDGTEIGWPTIHTNLEHLNTAVQLLGP